MALLTLFTAPKPFTDPHIATLQRNAIRSWLALGADVEVLLIGEEEGMAAAARELGVHQLTSVERNAEGTPLVSSIFELARQASDSPLLAYLNADILTLPDFLEGARFAATQTERFLIVGQRWDLDVTAPLDFSPDWQKQLAGQVRAAGRLHPPAGSDYFIFPRSLFADMPAFAIGRAGWDNWMIYHARRQGWPVIDGTASIHIIHQNHDYRHLPGGQPHYNLAESQRNISMAGGEHHMYTVLEASHTLVAGAVRPRPVGLVAALRRLELRLTPPAGQPEGWRWRLLRLARRWRKSLVTRQMQHAYWTEPGQAG